MTFGLRVVQWRIYKNINQSELARVAGITRPYLSRIEQNKVDPSLSILRRLAVALGLKIGDFLDESPHRKKMTRFQLDALARAAVNPSTSDNKMEPLKRRVARAFSGWRRASGLSHSQSKKKTSTRPVRGHFSLRRIRAVLGEEQYQALLRKIQKHGFQPLINSL